MSDVLTSNQQLAETLRTLARGYSTESGRDALLSAARIVEQSPDETAAPRIDYRNELRILLDSLTEDYELPAEAVARGNAAWRGEVKTPARYVRKETEDGPVTVECCPACGYPDRVIALKVQGEPELFVFGSAEATTVAQTALEYYGGRSSDGVSEKSSS